jgi:hypothetical protein
LVFRAGHHIVLRLVLLDHADSTIGILWDVPCKAGNLIVVIGGFRFDIPDWFVICDMKRHWMLNCSSRLSSDPTVLFVPASVRKLCRLDIDSVTGRAPLHGVTFESESQLIRIAFFLLKFESLKFICIPASVEILCERCFFGCRSLETLTFDTGSKLSYIEGEAFLNCRSLTSIFLPASVESIGSRAFAKCRNLRTLHFEAVSSRVFVALDFLSAHR